MVYGFIIGLLYCIGSVIITVMCDMVWHCITLDHWSRFLYLHYLLPWRRCSILECIFIIFAQTVFRNQSILCCIAGFEFFFTYLHNDKLWGLPRRVFTLFDFESLFVVTGKNGLFWEFCPWGGGGSPIPKSKCQNSDKILTFLWKPKMILMA